MKESHVILISVMVAMLALTGVIATIFYGDSIRVAFKTTDPLDPNFDPMNFNFRDYSNSGTRADAVAKMFPVGTERNYVRKVLNASNATDKIENFKGRTDADFYQYFPRKSKGTDSDFLFIYDDQQKLIKIACSANESCVLRMQDGE